MVKNVRIVNSRYNEVGYNEMEILSQSIKCLHFVMSGYFLLSELVISGVHCIFAVQLEYSVGIDENVFCFSFATMITKKMIEICGMRTIGLMWHK